MGKVRPDETEAEHEIRVQWIYANDVNYFWSLLMDISALVLGHATMSEDGHDGTLSTSIALVLLTTTVGGNMMFLRAMRRRNQLGVRLALVGNAVFALSLAFLMSYGLYRRAMKGTLHKLLRWHKFSSMGS